MQDRLALTRAQESRNAIERLYIEMRHLFNSGHYKPSGISGRVLKESLLSLSPEIYGSMTDGQKVELDGLVYVMDRLPRGIEECRFVKFISDEGYRAGHFDAIVPLKRRRNCYRIDSNQMFIEVTRGRSEIYDVMTHLTFLYNEADKVRRNAFDDEGRKSRDWEKLEKMVQNGVQLSENNRDTAFAYLSSILGRTFEQTKEAYERLDENPDANNGLFHIVYGLGRLAYEEEFTDLEREVSFSPALRERIGRHIYGERWAQDIKKALMEADLFGRPVHIISANMHSVLNALYAPCVLRDMLPSNSRILDLAMELRKEENEHLRKRVEKYASTHGMIVLPDRSATNLSVQIFDLTRLNLETMAPELRCDASYIQEEQPVLIVMDYAFGEQAYETMDELLKPMKVQGNSYPMPIASISIMGKAGILSGGKGDLMIPNAHVFEGTADNYPFQNEFTPEDFQGQGLEVLEGPMITVLGTSLQNRDVLSYFKNSSWKAIGLEMEGAHYQKAIQAEARIRKNIPEDIVLRYAYYASDNPLITGSTLASGSLGLIGVKPTYLITLEVLKKILNPGKKQASPDKKKAAMSKNGK